MEIDGFTPSQEERIREIIREILRGARETKVKLISIEEAESLAEEERRNQRSTFVRTNIACPECGAPLWRPLMGIRLGNGAAEYELHCEAKPVHFRGKVRL